MQLMKFSILTVFFLLSGTSFADDFFCNELFEIEDPNSRLVPANQKPQSMIDQERKKADLRFIQEAFTKASGEWIWRKAGQVWHEDEKRGLALMTKFKRTHVQLTEEEIKAFEEALQPVTDRWIKEVEAEGINGKKLVEKAKRLVEKYSNR